MTIPLKILIVDSCSADRAVMSTLARALGHSVVAAADGAQALALSDGGRPDLVLTEVRLPDLDGFELARRLRARPGGGQTLIFTVSGEASVGAVNRFAEAGVDGRLAKPLCRATLVRLLCAVAWNRSSATVRIEAAPAAVRLGEAV